MRHARERVLRCHLATLYSYAPHLRTSKIISVGSGPVHTYLEIFVSANSFMRIQKYLRPHVTYTNRIRPSTRIRFVSGHLKGLVNRACALRQRIQKYTDTSVHTYPDTQRIQKFPLWRAYTEISGYTERIRRTRVDARCIRIKKVADTKISGYVWTGPQSLVTRIVSFASRSSKFNP